MLQLLRVMFPYMLLVCLAAAFMGMLNARGHFFIPAMGATMLNVVMIASVLWLAPKMGLNFPKEERLPHQIFALAFGVLAAGVAQAAFQLPTLWRDGFRYRWVSPWRNETVGRVVRQMIPGTIGVAAFQINVLLTQSIAFWVSPQIVASFNYAVRLMELPQGMFGISLATYLLPTLSGLAAEKKYSEFRATLRHGVGTLIFFNLIAAILLVVLAEPIVRLLFERGLVHRRLHRPRDAGADMPRAGAGGVLDGQHPGARVLRAGRHQNADANQPREPGAESGSGRRARGTAAAGRTGHCQHHDFHLQRLAAALRAPAQIGKTGNGIAAGDAAAAGAGRRAGGIAGMAGLAILGKVARPPNHRA